MNDIQDKDHKDVFTMPAEGANQPKVDVSEPKTGIKTPEEQVSVDAQTERANDLKPAGLTASETMRFRYLESKQNITPEEIKELQSLGYKREHGLPAAQDNEIRIAASNSAHALAQPAVQPSTKEKTKSKSEVEDADVNKHPADKQKN